MRPISFALAPAAFLVSLTLMTPADAEACSCAAGPVAALPTWDSLRVPLNPQIRILYSYEAAQDLILVRSDGQIIETLQVNEPQGSLILANLFLAEGTYLSPSTEYTVFGDFTELHFTTGTGRDFTAPSLGAVYIEGGYDDGCTDGFCDSCGASTFMNPTYAYPSDNVTSANDLFYRVRVDVVGGESTELILPGGYGFGSGGCLSTVTGLEVGDVVTVHAWAIDAAGNESARVASEPTVVADDPDNQPGGGCDTRGGGSADLGLGLLGLLGLAGIPRRRR